MAPIFSQSYSKKLLRLISWSHWFTFFNIIAAVLLSTLYLVAEPKPETGFGMFYLITNWLGHTAFLTFIAFVLVVFPVIILFPYTRFIRGFASFVFTVYLSVLVLDTFTYSALGYHLNAQSSEQILQLITSQIEKDAKGFWLTTIFVSSLILAFQLVVSNYAWRHVSQLQQTHITRYGGLTFAACFMVSHASHIWADAQVNYDVLKQDNVLPFSYPTTAKTLLTKYGLFDKEYYQNNQTKPLTHINNAPLYPSLMQCNNTNTITDSVFIVLTKHQLTTKEVHQFDQRVTSNSVRVSQHVDDTNINEAWFALFYGLPNLYQEKIIQQQTSPVLFQLLHDLNLAKSLTVVSDDFTSVSESNKNDINSQLPFWLTQEFNKNKQDKITYLNNAASLVFGDSLQKVTQHTGLHVFYFDNKNNDQLDVFVDALLTSQIKQNKQDMIWVSSLGNAENTEAFLNKNVLFVAPKAQKSRIRVLTNHIDIPATFINQWLNCNTENTSYTTGSDMLSVEKNRVLANINSKGMMIYEKDKSMLVDKSGNVESYSRRIAAPINSKIHYPVLIDGVHYLKKYKGTKAISTNNTTESE